MLGLHGCAGFSLVVESGGHFLLQCLGFSLQWLLSLQSTDSGARELQDLWPVGSVAVVPRLWSTGSVVVAHGLSCSAACGNLPGPGIEPPSSA